MKLIEYDRRYRQDFIDFNTAWIEDNFGHLELEDYETFVNMRLSIYQQIRKSGRDFLTTAGRLYRYPFMDQLLIYAQRPDATACAELETWNQKMNCWFNRGSKHCREAIGRGCVC